MESLADVERQNGCTRKNIPPRPEENFTNSTGKPGFSDNEHSTECCRDFTKNKWMHDAGHGDTHEHQRSLRVKKAISDRDKHHRNQLTRTLDSIQYAKRVQYVCFPGPDHRRKGSQSMRRFLFAFVCIFFFFSSKCK